jgi:hypothetical protein
MGIWKTKMVDSFRTIRNCDAGHAPAGVNGWASSAFPHGAGGSSASHGSGPGSLPAATVASRST